MADKTQALKKIAGMLDGAVYYDGLHDKVKAAEAEAEELGIVILYGASDDLAEFAGAIEDETGCFEGGEVYIDKDGILEYPECGGEDCAGCGLFQAKKAKARRIEIIWDEEGEWLWSYKTDIPHETFRVFEEDGSKYCLGIVFCLPSE